MAVIYGVNVKTKHFLQLRQRERGGPLEVTLVLNEKSKASAWV
jgi:hypothetical protein